MGHAFLFISLTLDNLSSKIGNMDNQSTGKSHKALIITIATATLLLAGTGIAIYNLQTDVKQLSKEINRLQQLSKVGKKVKDNHKLHAQHKAEEKQQLNEKKTQAQQELTARGYTPSKYKRELVHAVQDDDTELLKLLLTAGVDPNYSDVLIKAVKSGKEECVQLLLAAPGINVNKEDEQGFTPLYCAAWLGRTECIKLLLAAPGIDVNKRTPVVTPLFSAARNGHTECVKLLEAAGARK